MKQKTDNKKNNNTNNNANNNANNDKSSPQTKSPIATHKKKIKSLFKSITTTKEQTQYEKLNRNYHLLLAEYANYKKHSLKQAEKFKKYEGQKLIQTLIGQVIDNFDRALEQKITERNKEQFKEGIVMVYNTFKNILKTEGVTELKCEGQPFNPTLHCALDSVATTDVSPNHIVQVVKKAYYFKDKLIRPADVIISKKQDPLKNTQDISEEH